MQPKTCRCMLAAILPLFMLAAIRLDAATVVRYAGVSASLADRWRWAADKAHTTQPGDGYWVVYSFIKKMHVNSFIGSYNSRLSPTQPTLSEILCGIKPNTKDLPAVDANCNGTFEGNFTFSADETDDTPVEKEIAVLYHFDRSSDHSLVRVKCSSMTLSVAFGNETIYWLGQASAHESLDKLTQAWENSGDSSPKKDILTAAGLHPVFPEQTKFLSSILNNKAETSLRGDAAFWLGEGDSHEALGILTHTVQSDPSTEVRKKALFALSEMNDSVATDALISCARTCDRVELRKEAIFWIGQKAAGKSPGVLQSIIDEDPDRDIRKSALFALSQLPDNGGITPLIAIARKHPDRDIRKEAIFMLSQSDDPRAVDALIAIVRP
jgi:hypothetical protein